MLLEAVLKVPHETAPLGQRAVAVLGDLTPQLLDLRESTAVRGSRGERRGADARQRIEEGAARENEGVRRRRSRKRGSIDAQARRDEQGAQLAVSTHGSRLPWYHASMHRKDRQYARIRRRLCSTATVAICLPLPSRTDARQSLLQPPYAAISPLQQQKGRVRLAGLAGKPAEGGKAPIALPLQQAQARHGAFQSSATCAGGPCLAGVAAFSHTARAF